MKTNENPQGRVEINTRMPVATSQLLADASERTGQTKTSIIIDALHWYCGKAKDDQDIALRRSSVLAALHGTTEFEMKAASAAIAKLAAQMKGMNKA